MAETTGIEWCDSTFNPWMGCTKVSPACDDCYAARSTPARTLGIQWGPGQPRRRTSDANWKLPLQWQRQAAEFMAQHGRRRRVFCASLADVFDNEVEEHWRLDLFWLIHKTPDLDWLLLTKRIGNAASMIRDAVVQLDPAGEWPVPLPNVWIGATVVTQAEADRDVPKLLATPAAVRFLSIEPMLGPVNLELLPFGPSCTCCGQPVDLDAFTGITCCTYGCGGPMLSRIDWVICGGESGPNARPMHPDWARSLRDQCAAAGVPFLFKQWGEWIDDGNLDSARLSPPQIADPEERFNEFDWGPAGTSSWRIGKKAAGRLLDGRTHDEFPAAAA